MTKLTVTKLDQHSPEYGRVEFSDGVRGSYCSTVSHDQLWFTRNAFGSLVVSSGKRVELLKLALAQAEG